MVLSTTTLVSLHNGWLGHIWRRVVRDPPSREKEQSNECAPSNLWIMMGARTWTCPARALPSRHAHQLGGLVQLHYTVDLTIRMRMILAPIHIGLLSP